MNCMNIVLRQTPAKFFMATTLLSLAVLFFAGTTHAQMPGNKAKPDSQTDEVILLFTNDFESAFDPIPAYWSDQYKYLGGAAEMTTLIKSLRGNHENVFLFSAGDIFTGILSKLTEGAVPMEMMITMDYDAMAIGNHEFEYGWQTFARQKDRLPFPVLGANLFYKDSGLPYAQAYTIIEHKGIRIGVIGVMGQDAATAIIPSHIAGIDVRDPIAAVSKYVNLLRDEVDLIVVLTHQGKTAPMQTDDEAHPEIQRGIASEIKLAGAVPGIDVIFSGHADSGTEQPFVHPETGTLIMQTYGQGTRLGYLSLSFDPTEKRIIAYEGHLIPVDSERLLPDPTIAQKLAKYKARFPQLAEVICQSDARLVRNYNEESDLGNLYSDIARRSISADIGFIPSGSLRKDLPKGPVPLGDIMDSFPFTDDLVKLEMTGQQILGVLEQSLTLERGILQASGINVKYDLNRPKGKRVVAVKIGDKTLVPGKRYTVATIEIMAQGGDLYEDFKHAKRIPISPIKFSEVLTTKLRGQSITIPDRGRLIRIN